MSFPPANHDPSIDPTAEQVRRLRDSGPDGPIVMLNLLKFRQRAAYPEGHPDSGASGADAYARYQHAFTVTVGATSGAEILFEGPVDQVFIGRPETDRWDKCLIVRYPSRRHFLAMMADAAYREALVHRYAGLEKTLLLQMHGS
ncbi:MAG: DUF1330 domain-containing protein [Sphingomonadaceae bacterium]